MLLVILGAGATYDSDPKRMAVVGGVSSQDRPPLTAELFDGRFAKLSDYPDCRRIIPQLRTAAEEGRSIEQEMETIRAQARGPVPSLEKALDCMRGYLAAVVTNAEAVWNGGHDGVTNHMRLFAEIENWREETGDKVRVVTFNYDMLAERAIESLGLGLGFGAAKSYRADDRYRVFKLHGSTNWWRQTTEVSPAGWPDALPKAEMHFSPYRPAGTVGGPTWVPAISVPLERKTDSEFECPDEHLALLKEELPDVDRVISIGWRGQEAHFKQLWHDHPPRRLRGRVSVSGSRETALDVAERLTLNTQTAQLPIIGEEGFSKFMASNQLRAWL